MTIAVDFDGTIVEHRYPAIGKEMPYAIETLKKLQSDRHRLILWTAREGKLLSDAVEYCKSRGLEFYAVNSDLPNDRWRETSPTRKLKVDLFIDDRNLGGLPDWPVIYKMISGGLTFGDIINQGIILSQDEDMADDKQGFLARLRDKCSSSRDRLGRGKSSSRYTSHHENKHHW